MKKKKEKNENKNKKKKLQDNGDGTERKKRKKLEHCWTQHMKKERKKERTFFLNRQYIDWKKKKRKLNIFELWL